MCKYKFNPFANESDAIAIGDLNIENRIDRVSIFGGLDITRDKEGLKNARELKALMERVVDTLQAESLPDHVQPGDVVETVANPFHKRQ